MFYYRKGDLVTTNSWNKPTIKVFNKWLDEWSKIPGVDNYNLYLTGGFAQIYYFSDELSLLNTWDIDIMLLKKSNTNIDYFELKNILDKADEIAWKNYLLVDARCVVNGLNPIQEGTDYKDMASAGFKDPTINIINHKIVQKKGLTHNERIIYNRLICHGTRREYALANEFYKKANFIQKIEDESQNFVELIPGLYEQTESPERNYEKFKSKNYKGPPYIRLIPEQKLV